MDESESPRGGSTLAQAASALIAAEAALSEADVRIQQARRERRAAFEQLIRCQKQINDAVAELQRWSVPTSDGGREQAQDAPLILKPEDVARDGITPVRPHLAAVAAEFDRLKTVSDAAGNDSDGTGGRMGGAQ